MARAHRRFPLSATLPLFVLLTGACGGDETGPAPDPGELRVKNGDVTLAATLDLPTTPGPHPVMVVIPGSGRTTRAADRPAVDIAVPQGIGVLRYDKRGLGQSSGTFEEVTVANSERVLALRASDVRALVEALAARPDVRANAIFLWSTSQGGWVAPLVAASTNRVAFIIAVNGGGSPVGIEGYYDELATDPSRTIEQMTAQLRSFTGPLGYDPRPVLAALRTPVLWIFGGQDRSNPTFYDIAELEQIKAANANDFTIQLIPRMDHDLRDVDTGTFPATLFPTVFDYARARVTGQ